MVILKNIQAETRKNPTSDLLVLGRFKNIDIKKSITMHQKTFTFPVKQVQCAICTKTR